MLTIARSELIQIFRNRLVLVTGLVVPVGMVIAVATWVGTTGTEDLARVKRLLPGGSATEMVVNAWNGSFPLTDSLPLLATTLGWVAVSIAMAVRLFRWEPRR